MALIPSILVALSDSVEWMPSLDCSESSGMSTTLTQSALDYAIAGSAIALGEGEVVALATFIFSIHNQLLLNILQVISQKYGHNL